MSTAPPDTGGGTAEVKKQKQCTILVTGFAPFQDKFPVNPSFEIAKRLPQLLPATEKDTTSVRLIVHPEAIPVRYKDVYDLVPALLNSYAETIDFVLHIGMASGREWYALECQAHRDGYKNPDVDGNRLPTAHGSTEFGDCSDILTTSTAYDQIMAAWRKKAEAQTAFGDLDVRSSDDPGHYLCDYIYFNSLAWFARKDASSEHANGKKRPALFLHVPADSDDASLTKGIVVTEALLRAIAESLDPVRETDDRTAEYGTG
ncbi:hypothetical protein B0A48_05548 [Cryoendolithus antarcticus]|uniref:Peptidase C15, pyroglutamyl peptidase I-like protein n=1 Tax=Cryoendolithus antarcticus TaxID=1507870 RepID=A0A1V8TJ97_9PEZI|nr:hypothetical protein B0A48_05548 [Cryoendolithus antarcticus]